MPGQLGREEMLAQARVGASPAPYRDLLHPGREKGTNAQSVLPLRHSHPCWSFLQTGLLQPVH